MKPNREAIHHELNLIFFAMRVFGRDMRPGNADCAHFGKMIHDKLVPLLVHHFKGKEQDKAIATFERMLKLYSPDYSHFTADTFMEELRAQLYEWVGGDNVEKALGPEPSVIQKTWP